LQLPTIMLTREGQYLLASIVESSQDSIVTIDLNRIVTSWNAGAENLYGYKAEEIIGQSLEMVLLPEDIKSLIGKVQNIIDEITVPIYETIRIHKNGRHADLEIMLSPVRDTRGHVAGVSTIARDITVRKMQEQQKDEFIAIASHELKTPVTSIKAFTHLLHQRAEGLKDDITTSMIKKLDSQVDRLIALIGTLLDTTKLAAGELLLNIEEVDINAVIRDQTEDAKFISDRHEIIFLAGQTGMVPADKKLIGQVIANMISNAIKYSPKGGEVLVRSFETGDGVQISIQDHGVGIRNTEKDKIFDRYFRVRNPETINSSGIGLGLYISAGIVRQHGGTIAVESEEGRGSTFSFTLPYTRPLSRD